MIILLLDHPNDNDTNDDVVVVVVVVVVVLAIVEAVTASTASTLTGPHQTMLCYRRVSDLIAHRTVLSLTKTMIASTVLPCHYLPLTPATTATTILTSTAAAVAINFTITSLS